MNNMTKVEMGNRNVKHINRRCLSSHDHQVGGSSIFNLMLRQKCHRQLK